MNVDDVRLQLLIKEIGLSHFRKMLEQELYEFYAFLKYMCTNKALSNSQWTISIRTRKKRSTVLEKWKDPLNGYCKLRSPKSEIPWHSTALFKITLAVDYRNFQKT
jgi:hypothetical protein